MSLLTKFFSMVLYILSPTTDPLRHEAAFLKNPVEPESSTRATFRAKLIRYLVWVSKFTSYYKHSHSKIAINLWNHFKYQSPKNIYWVCLSNEDKWLFHSIVNSFPGIYNIDGVDKRPENGTRLLNLSSKNI